MDMQQSLERKSIVDNMEDNFELVFTFRATCTKFLVFLCRDHVKLWVLEKEVAPINLPTSYQWREVEKFGRSKYTLHTQA